MDSVGAALERLFGARVPIPGYSWHLRVHLRAAFEDRKLRIVRDDKLRADLRAMRKEVTPSGNIRLNGQADDSHCDRFWAKALRQHAARQRSGVGAALAI